MDWQSISVSNSEWVARSEAEEKITKLRDQLAAVKEELDEARELATTRSQDTLGLICTNSNLRALLAEKERELAEAIKARREDVDYLVKQSEISDAKEAAEKALRRINELERVEWVDFRDYHWCPWCGKDQHVGHAPDCHRKEK
jgi:nitrogen fixation/metabolism regulation signal transduction histidine kinase